MSRIPNCREDNVYNQDFLNINDERFITGADCAIANMMDLLVNNLSLYKEELNTVLPEGQECPENEVFSTRADLYEILEANKEIIANIFYTNYEASRNHTIVQMIDEMGDDEYCYLRDAAMQSNPEKKYHDTRAFRG